MSIIAQILCLNPSSLNPTYLGPHSWDRNRISTERYHMNLDTKYKFYLGGTDSCQGDSGGPIIAFMKFKDGTNRGFTMGTGLPSRQFHSVCLEWKIMSLHRGLHSLTPHCERCGHLSFLPSMSSAQSKTLQGLFELTWHTLRTLNLAFDIACGTTKN